MEEWTPVRIKTLKRLDGSMEDLQERPGVIRGALYRGATIELVLTEEATPGSDEPRLQARITSVETAQPRGGPGHVEVIPHVHVEEIA